MKKETKFHICIIALNLLFLGGAVWGYLAIDKMDPSKGKITYDKLEEVHKERIKSEDPALLKSHAEKIWVCFATTESHRKSIFNTLKSTFDVVIWIFIFQLILFFIYYISKIQTKKSQQKDLGDSVPPPQI